MGLNELREEIDGIDRELVGLFVKRMAACKKIGAVKREASLPVRVPAREAEKLRAVEEMTGDELAPYAAELYRKLFELSRRFQEAEK